MKGDYDPTPYQLRSPSLHRKGQAAVALTAGIGGALLAARALADEDPRKGLAAVLATGVAGLFGLGALREVAPEPPSALVVVVIPEAPIEQPLFASASDARRIP